MLFVSSAARARLPLRVCPAPRFRSREPKHRTGHDDVHGQASGSKTPITATATDATGVTKVEFYVNSVLSCTGTVAPYSCNWKVPSGTNKNYALMAKAYDAAKNSGSSSTVTVTSK